MHCWLDFHGPISISNKLCIQWQWNNEIWAIYSAQPAFSLLFTSRNVSLKIMKIPSKAYLIFKLLTGIFSLIMQYFADYCIILQNHSYHNRLNESCSLTAFLFNINLWIKRKEERKREKIFSLSNRLQYSHNFFRHHHHE